MGHFEKKARDQFKNRKWTENEYLRFWGISGKNAYRMLHTSSRAKYILHIIFRSFQDSDDDGTGDLIGITNRLDHLVNIGVGAFWLSPIYKSPMADFGYDISDYQVKNDHVVSFEN